MRKYIFAAVVAATLWAGAAQSATAGEFGMQQAAQPTPYRNSEDPFAELLRNNPAQVVQTGPSCRFIKIQLPPGVNPEDIR